MEHSTILRTGNVRGLYLETVTESSDRYGKLPEAMESLMQPAQEQLPFFEFPTARFPSTRYQGSKSKLARWILEQIDWLEFDSCLDAFCGTCSVAWHFKQAGKQVVSNDVLQFNFLFGQALIENNEVQLSDEDVDYVLDPSGEHDFPNVVQSTFSEIYFTDKENAWIDRTISRIRRISDPYKRSLSFFALSQACIVKRPYNLFHRKNLYLRFADVQRSFGNKTSWDRPFEDWFRIFAHEANGAVFDNGRENRSLNFDVMELEPKYDLVYFDPPYISGKGTGIDYRDFYHFLEGLSMYDQWPNHIDLDSKNRRLKRLPNCWHDKKRIHKAFDRLFDRFRKSILVVSYRTDGIPSATELIKLLSRHKHDVRIYYYGKYRYALSKNTRSEEMLLVAL